VISDYLGVLANARTSVFLLLRRLAGAVVQRRVTGRQFLRRSGAAAFLEATERIRQRM
jgi:hypothetical protein